jgi:transcriptional regulator with XRE-family HTH domain
LTGAELKQLRKSLNLSLAQAARQVEVTPRTWARWETSEQVPDGAVKLFRVVNGLEPSTAVQARWGLDPGEITKLALDNPDKTPGELARAYLNEKYSEWVRIVAAMIRARRENQ